MNAYQLANEALRVRVADPPAMDGHQHDQCFVAANCPCRTLRCARRREVLHCLMHGFSEKQAARSLGISSNTVHCHVTAIYRHFAVCTRAELLARILVMLMREVAQEARAAKPLPRASPVRSPRRDVRPNAPAMAMVSQ